MIDKIIDETKRWTKKADTDLRVAKKLFGEEPPWVITFHAQQAVEKFLKAYLVYRQKRFRKTHNILELLELCMEVDRDFEELMELGLERLKEYATEFKYPSYYEPSEEEGKEAIEIAEKVREFVLKKIDVPF